MYIVLFTAIGILLVMIALDLVLTVGVIRRLRELEARSALLSDPGPSPEIMRAVGEQVEEFTATDADGREFHTSEIDGYETLIGVFAQGCSSCEERMPDFIDLAQHYQEPSKRVVSLFVGDKPPQQHLVELSEVGRVLLEDKPGMAASTALGVKGYPALAVVDADRVVRAAGTVVGQLTPVGR